MQNRILTPEAIVGFFVGEGTFGVESGKDDKYQLGWRIRPYVSVNIRKDDESILQEMTRIIGCGHIYELDYGRYERYKSRGWKPQVRWKVSNIDDLSNKVVPFFKQHGIFGMKAQAFGIFSQIVEAKYKKEDRNPKMLEHMRALARSLQAINKRGI